MAIGALKMKPRDSMPTTDVDLLVAERLEHELDRLLERARVLEQRGDVVEQDARLGKVGDLADLRAQIFCGHGSKLPRVGVPVWVAGRR